MEEKIKSIKAFENRANERDTLKQSEKLNKEKETEGRKWKEPID